MVRRKSESPRQPRGRRATEIDKRIGRNVFEVKRRVRGARVLQTAILRFAYFLDRNPELEGHLVLVNPALSEGRIRSEWENASRVLKQFIHRRLHIIIADGEEYKGLPGPPARSIRSHLPALLAEESRLEARLPRPDYFFVILKILVSQWLIGAGPVTAKWIGTTTGCSYPTVAKALHRLKPVIKRHSYRRVELNRFPREAWGQLLALSDSVRLTTRFADRSGKPRKPEELLRRLKALDRPDLAVGGSKGARYWYPDLDLVGDPRLDISIHCAHGQLDLAFVDQLDPALEVTKDRLEPTTLVIHAIRREVSFFEVRPQGINIADPVECLLDLHEMRLEPQAREFVRSFGRKGGGL
jgi:hypothetical protein